MNFKVIYKHDFEKMFLVMNVYFSELHKVTVTVRYTNVKN